MEKLRFSVLLSLYVAENPIFLDQALESIWDQQSLKPTEVVLVLDGPITTELMTIVKQWKVKIGSRVKVVALPQNIGLGKALNEGLKHCSYNWVFRMDTDDICAFDRFEKQVKFIARNPDVVLFGCQMLEFDLNINDAHILKEVPTEYEAIKRFATIRSPFNHITVAYKKDVILGLGGYQHHLFMEDYNLWLRVIGHGYKVANLSDVLLFARVGNGMHARRRGIEYIKSEKQLLDLKKELKLQHPTYANMLFLLRSLFRLMPSSVLGKFYNTFLRKKVKKKRGI